MTGYIDIRINTRLGEFQLNAELRCPASGVTALFGRSGSGKTSLINAVAGLLAPQSGRIAIGDRVLFDTDSRINLPPHKRRVGYVFQQARLFPHLNVRANLVYGMPGTGDGPGLDEIVTLLGLEHLIERRPHHLSGGERQRVAIGRAILSNPSVLLMDEPLSALDGAHRGEILDYLARLRGRLDIPILYVSHQMNEVVRLADTLAIMSDGEVAASGTVEDITSRLDLRPLTGRFEAGSVLAGTIVEHDPSDQLTRLSISTGDLWVPLLDSDPGQPVRIRIRARDVALARRIPDDTSFLNVLQGKILEIGVDQGSFVDVKIALDADTSLWARITRRSFNKLKLVTGDPIVALIKTVAIGQAYSTEA
jgi:molybdate transport system ATP-binding protein